MNRFLRYLCFYCASRLVYSTIRDLTRDRVLAKNSTIVRSESHCGHGPMLATVLMMLLWVTARAAILWSVR